MEEKKRAVRCLWALAYAVAAWWALTQGLSLLSRTRNPGYSGVVFNGVLMLGNALVCVLLLRKDKRGRGFVTSWNWIFLVLALLGVWLSPSPETRVPDLYLLGFALLAATIFRW